MHAVSGAAAGGGAGGTGGRPDERAPHLAVLRQRAGDEGVLVSIVANVNLTTREGAIAYIHPVINLHATPAPEQSDVVIRTTRSDEASLDEFPVAVKLSSELAPDDDLIGLVDAVLPVSAEASTVELVIAGQVADSFRVGGPPPAVRVVQPVALEDQALRVAVDLERELEETHTYAVQVSADRGQTWQTVGVGLRQPLFTLDRSQFADGQELQIRVITTSGLASCTTTGEPFRVGDPKARSR
jgi:hypothetical protein